MKINSFKYYIGILTLASLISCEVEYDKFDSDDGNGGTADFTTFISVGNSLTAGYSNGGLYEEVQKTAFPALIHSQISKVTTTGSFTTPLIEGGYSTPGTTELGFGPDCTNTVGLGPKARADNSLTAYGPSSASSINNYGVPGIRLDQINLVGLGTAAGNPFFARITSNSFATYIDEVSNADPTFFTFWLGNNDVLGYAANGGEQGSDLITTSTVFNDNLTISLDSLTKDGAKGVIANLPSITAAPYFSTVPAKGLPLTSPTQVAQLQAAYAAYNVGAKAFGLDTFSFALGANYFVIEEPKAAYTALGNIRPIKPNELVLLTVPQDSIKCAQWGSAKPIPAKYVLDQLEINKINTAVDDYNEMIATAAKDNNLGLVDINTLMNTLNNKGLNFDGIEFTTEYVSGGAFSLDGIHLTARGNAIIANEFIKTINRHYSAKIPSVSVTDYEGVKFP